MKTRFFALAALALALVACNNDNENLNGDLVAAQFTADIAPATRASGTTWDNGDRIGITDIDNDTQYGNVPFILKNGKFEAEGKVIYIEDTKTHTFRAYYPYNAAGGILTATTDATAQQNQPAIDFLFASGATGDKNNPVVSFTDKTAKGGEDNSFHHRMSRITLTFEAGDGVDFSVVKPERYTLDGLLLTGTFNTADGIATADNGAQTGELTMNLADGNLTSSIILFPQTVASLPLVVNYKGQEYHATLTMPEGALQAGNNYTYTVKVNATGLTLEGCTIGNWVDGGGESGAAEDLGYSIQNDGSYMVYNAKGLLAWNEAAQKDESINCTLTADIDLTGKNWTPIGTSFRNKYTGTFDGGGHTIKGLTVTTNDQFVGLFGSIGNAGTVKNVMMEGVQITKNHSSGFAGGVAGYSDGTIENCSVSGSVSGTVYVGGVVGAQWEGSITGCSSSATVKGTVEVGGVAGETNSSATLTACYATGNVTIEINPRKNIAGGSLVGMNAGSSVLACYATGNVASTGSSTGKVYIGGFLGGNYATVTACYWKNNHEQGIGYNKEGIAPEVTKVDGSVVTWQKAVDAMNRALQNAGSEWRYELNGALPTLRKQ
nr:fimbrillin family protein [uncultured Prevotella sp.]